MWQKMIQFHISLSLHINLFSYCLSFYIQYDYSVEKFLPKMNQATFPIILTELFN